MRPGHAPNQGCEGARVGGHVGRASGSSLSLWLTPMPGSGRLPPMPKQEVPARIAWAVGVLDVRPNDQVLEIGCGPGAAAELICARLEKGRLFAIDRSESGVDRTKRRNAAYVEAG